MDFTKIKPTWNQKISSPIKWQPIKRAYVFRLILSRFNCVHLKFEICCIWRTWWGKKITKNIYIDILPFMKKWVTSFMVIRPASIKCWYVGNLFITGVLIIRNVSVILRLTYLITFLLTSLHSSSCCKRRNNFSH